MDQRERIEGRLKTLNLAANSWSDGEDGPEAHLGRWYAVDDHGVLCEGDEGTLKACVVGSAEYGNERVSFWFTPDGYSTDAGEEVEPFEHVEPA